jgi:hypothetical protein
MKTTGRVLQTATAWCGFLAGYLWVVHRWGKGWGLGESPVLGRTFVGWGLVLSTVYAVLLAGLFWPILPSPRTSGLRMVVSPTAFTLSFLLAALGVSWALGAMG